MFTGIITDVGRLEAKDPFGNGARLAIACTYPSDGIAVGASISCGGCCLTVTGVEPHDAGARFTVDVSAETMDKTTIGHWSIGERINLERSLRAGDELGGHLVSGHVDGVALIVGRTDGADMSWFTFEPPRTLLPLLATKGSVALDGTSLTVNEADKTFSVAMIPHTLSVTTWGERQVGQQVNIEVDTIARYVARLVEWRAA